MSKYKSLLLNLYPIRKFTIIGQSMSPALQEGDEILINTLAYLFTPPRIGQIIALHSPDDNRILIKRIEKIENKLYFVIGDNKNHSTDSRKFGMLEKGNIIGKVIFHKPK